ncbi:hypothetical protein GCM10012275_39400 [Longimycelium tulufanense]|uniref:Uncharacterized protein n=1 Tax=Longimycelium tulufanense TaxID=907463 RepID=A0A8J3CGT5_9PSEU|nr:hypothetical protein GCM10012275_39400 [Longimycelium tulufanense]
MPGPGADGFAEEESEKREGGQHSRGGARSGHAGMYLLGEADAVLEIGAGCVEEVGQWYAASLGECPGAGDPVDCVREGGAAGGGGAQGVGDLATKACRGGEGGQDAGGQGLGVGCSAFGSGRGMGAGS